MIEHASGNLLEADVEALVNSVNTVGVMGKGVALQFRQAFPENYEAYRKACAKSEVKPGRILVYATNQLTNPLYILNFPTKRHWRGKARIEDIETGLEALVRTIRQYGIRSVALPPLGCGNGGLAWIDVLPRIEKAFEALPDVHALVYAPEGAPQPDRMQVATTKPRMTPTRAALLGLLRAYALPGYRVTMLELQKLAYFLQQAGEPMRLKFAKGSYGPYSETLHHVLQRLEGHFIRGYGDRSREVSIRLLPDAPGVVDRSLEEHEETARRLARVADLIEGFETPYGLELLATVHKVTQEKPAARNDPEVALADVHSWSDRKKRRFDREDVELAWSHLHQKGWF